MKNSQQTYSPFWALAALFLTFIFVQGVNLKEITAQRSQLQAAHAELEKILPEALKINKTVENLGNDLLSMTNQEARQIVADFKITPTAPAAPAK
jgi:hypothetical protein